MTPTESEIQEANPHMNCVHRHELDKMRVERDSALARLKLAEDINRQLNLVLDPSDNFAIGLLKRAEVAEAGIAELQATCGDLTDRNGALMAVVKEFAEKGPYHSVGIPPDISICDVCGMVFGPDRDIHNPKDHGNACAWAKAVELSKEKP